MFLRLPTCPVPFQPRHPRSPRVISILWGGQQCAVGRGKGSTTPLIKALDVERDIISPARAPARLSDIAQIRESRARGARDNFSRSGDDLAGARSDFFEMA